MKSISQKSIVKFVFRNIICRFGVPVQIITDNGTQFAGSGMKKLCKDNEIKLSFASVYHPQTNEQVEETNKTMVKILKRKIGENPKEWAELIPEVLWAYRTTIKTANGNIPFNLAFGIEAVAPCELIWPTTRILRYDEENNEEEISKSKENLENIREEAEIKEIAYKRRLERRFNRGVKERKLAPGDLVLRNARLTMTEQNKGKLSQNWEGPYIIKEEWKAGTFKLVKEDGTEIPRTWHTSNLRKYFP